MTNNTDTQPDLEKQEDLKAKQTASLLKWGIMFSAGALLVIVGVAIPMAIKVLKGTSTPSLVAVTSDAAKRPEPTVLPSRPQVEPGSPTAYPTEPTDKNYIVRPPTPTPNPTTKIVEHTDNAPLRSPIFAPTTLSPTRAPTPLPTARPTTMQPTFPPIDPSYAFKMRLFWQHGYYWQESFEEVWYCLECTRCNSYGPGDGVEYGCKEYPNGDASYCQAGDMFWIVGCSSGQGARFNVLQNPGSGHQIRLAGTNLCMGRGAFDKETGEWKRRLMQAVTCNKNDPNQLWAPFTDLSKFELRPFDHRGLTEEDADCVSQLHHPKREEIISLHNCKLCRIYETRFWEEYKE